MATAPYGIRLLVGAATVAVEETRKLPQTILMYPMTLASQAAHIVMRWQQSLAELAVKGDSTLETLFPPKDEQPDWATFDEDLEDGGEFGSAESDGQYGDDASGDGERRSEGRFALYSEGDPGDRHTDEKSAPAAKSTAGVTAPVPDIAVELDYGSLTLAQLRARLTSLSADDLQNLLTYEEATKARAPFQTLLTNRIAHATAK